MKNLVVFLFMVLSFLKLDAQISKINLTGKLNLDTSFFSGFQKGRPSTILVCFLDSSKTEFKAVENSIRKKLPNFSSDVSFLILTFSPSLDRNDLISIGDYQILEPQFYILSDLCTMLDSTYLGFDWRYSDLPKALKKIDTKQCYIDKRTETLLNQVVWNTLGGFVSIYKSNEYIMKLKSSNDREFKIQKDYTDRLVGNLNIDSLRNQLNGFQKDISDLKNQSDANVKMKTNDLHYYFWFSSIFSFSNSFSSNNLTRVVLGRSLDFFKCKSVNLSLNIGVQQSNDFWSKGDFQNQVVSVLNPNQQLDELLVSSSNVKENYNLSATSAIIGFDFKHYLGKSKAYFGLYFNVAKPIIYNLSFANTSGDFDYVGISNAIQEPLTNIPELGLVSGVSYVGNKSDLAGKLNTFYDCGAMFGYSIGEKSPVDINFSVGLTSSKKFDLKQSNSTISSTYGEYNSIATVNSTQISVPRFWNLGFSVRKYLN
jgi:hypothetical protein